MENVNVLVGFASEFADAPGQLPTDGLPAKMVPVRVFPGCETAFVTMAIDHALLHDLGERKELAGFIADAVREKVQSLIEQGPQVGAIL